MLTSMFAACDCPTGKTRCAVDVPGGGYQCVDLQNDDFHCGGCGTKCALGYQICVSGKCIECKVPTCTPPLVFDRATCSCVCGAQQCLGSAIGCCVGSDLCCEDGCCANIGANGVGATCCSGKCCNNGSMCCGQNCCSNGCCNDGTCMDAFGRCQGPCPSGYTYCWPIDDWCCRPNEACLGGNHCDHFGDLGDNGRRPIRKATEKEKQQRPRKKK